MIIFGILITNIFTVRVNNNGYQRKIIIYKTMSEPTWLMEQLNILIRVEEIYGEII